MNKKTTLTLAACLLLSFILWTLLIALVNVEAIGPEGSTVGLATLNRLVRDAIGVRTELYLITDWLGLIPMVTAAGFGILGLWQWIKRRRITLVDRDILALGGLYVVVIAVFELCVINRRPVLIDGVLEASYPSSTTLLSTCVMPTAAMQLHRRIRHTAWRRALTVVVWGFTVFMVIGRILSGVHWITDIIGGGLLSAALVTAYAAVADVN